MDKIEMKYAICQCIECGNHSEPIERSDGTTYQESSCYECGGALCEECAGNVPTYTYDEDDTNEVCTACAKKIEDHNAARKAIGGKP